MSVAIVIWSLSSLGPARESIVEHELQRQDDNPPFTLMEMSDEDEAEDASGDAESDMVAGGKAMCERLHMTIAPWR